MRRGVSLSCSMAQREVKAQMRSERYDELVSQRAEAIDVTDLPWDALYRFTAGRLG